jgi:hypothetical protein
VPANLPVLPEAAVIRRALAASLSRLADALSPRTQGRAWFELAARKLEAENRELQRQVAFWRDAIEQERADALRETLREQSEAQARIAEREWKPWPPEVRDGRQVVFCSPEEGQCFVMKAYDGNYVTGRCFYLELPNVPPKGDDHA